MLVIKGHFFVLHLDSCTIIYLRGDTENNMRVSKTILLICFLLSCFTSSGQLIITPNSTAQSLAQRLVGEGVTISNVSFTGNPLMAAFFDNTGGTNINIDSGIVLTSGRAKTSDNFTGLDGNGSTAAQSILANGMWGLPGDPDLAAAIGSPVSSLRDACVLEFDFIPLGDSIKFKYVFSSEEYTPAFVCQFNDAFAFFISGPGIAGLKNIALVPGTSTPVSIFNVNDVPGGTCPNNPGYYIDNISNVFFTHDGHTKVLTAEEMVQPCQTYHLKLVISDLIDTQFDSGVFLEAKSLSSNAIGMSNQTQVDPTTGNNYLAEGCQAGSFTIRRPKKEPTPLIVTLNYSGTAINGTDVILLPSFVTIPANDSFVTVNIVPIVDGLPEGIEELKVYALGGCASGTASDSTLIQIRDYDILTLSPDTAIVCRGGSIQLMASAGYTSYQWLPDPTLSNTGIRDPVATPVNISTTYICTATLGTCNARDSVFLSMRGIDFISKTDVNCKNGTTGQIKVAGGPEWAQPVQFSVDGINWQADSTFNNLAAGNYWVRIKDAVCRDSIAVSLVQAFPDLLITNIAATQASCSGNPDGTLTVSASGGNNTYSYSIDGVNFQPSNIFNVLTGTHIITVRDGNGCLVSQSATVTLNNTATVDAGADNTICEGTSFMIPAVSNGSSFSWTPAVSLNNATMLTPTASPSASTKYFITATLGICTATDSMQLFIRPAPIPNAGSDLDICYGRVYQLSGSGGVSYEWTPATHFVSSTTVPNPDVRAYENITYSLMVTDAFGCRSLIPDQVFVKVTPSVRIFAGNDTIVAANQPVQLLVRELSNAGVTSYSWAPATFLSNANIASPIATLTTEQRFIVTATTPAGCQAVDDVLIKVYKGPDIYVPSAFTPNNDGLNDRLGPIPVGIKEFKYFRVFNRWGQVIFSSNDPSKTWDGKVNGLPQPTSTFVWMAEAIDYKGILITRKGVVTVIR